MKKILKLFLVTLLIISSMSYVYAADTIVIHDDQSHEDVSVREVAPCPENGIHYMYARGWAKVYSSDGEFRMNMNAHVCKYCGEMFLCTGEPAAGGSIGTYITGVDSEGQDGYSWIVYTDNNTYYSNNSTMPGYRFLYN